MKKISKIIQNIEYTFSVDTETKNPNFLIVVISIVVNQEAQFSKLDYKSSILKEIALDTAKAINEKFILVLNPYDSGVEWHGQFKLN